MAATEPAVPFVEPNFDLEAVTNLLAELTAHEREVIILTSYCGYTTDQAADALGVPDAEVLARIRSGMLRLAGAHLHMGLAKP